MAGLVCRYTTLAFVLVMSFEMSGFVCKPLIEDPKEEIILSNYEGKLGKRREKTCLILRLKKEDPHSRVRNAFVRTFSML